MIDDDDIRRALRDAAPAAPDPAPARHRLAPAMTRARRRRRLRSAAGAASLTLAVGLGGAAALDQLSSPDTTEIGPADTLPPPDLAEPDTITSTTAPPDGIAAAPTDTTPTAATPTTVSPTSATSSPTESSPTESSPTASSSPTAAPTATATTPPPSTPAGAPAPVSASTVSGPHVTACGSVTFVHDDSTVQLTGHDTVTGYRFRIESESPTQIEVKWDGGPGEECEIHAHLEDTGLVIDGDDDHD